MEFFKTVNVCTDEHILKNKLNFNNLSEIYSDFVVLENGKTECQVGTIWGEFTLVRNEINGGVRFSLKECPNALAWSLTTGYPPAKDKIVIHLTINRTEITNKFLEEINEFISNWSEGLLKNSEILFKNN